MKMKRASLLISTLLTITISVFAQETATSLFDKGKEIKNAGKYSEALTYFLKATEKKPDYGEAWYEVGWYYNEINNFKEAVKALNKANEYWKDQYKVFYELGYALYSLDSADGAITNFNKALTINPQYLLGYMGLGDVFRRLKENSKEAITRYRKVLEYDKNNRKANYWIGWCANDLGQFDVAIVHLKKAIELDGTDMLAKTELGYSYYASGQFENAIAVLKETEKAIPKIETALFYQGMCYVKVKNKADAVKKYNELEIMGSEHALELLSEIRTMK
jgi:tetratricopeptide (TPR) repeat protein